jgi:hypothetical protein
MTNPDDLFVAHLGRYHLSLPRIAEEHFFGPKESKAALARLKAQGRIRMAGVGRSPHGFSYYQLTVTEARRLNVPEHRAKRMNGEAMHKSLATLWFCMCGPYERVRLDTGEYPVEDFGPPPNTKEPICAEAEDDRCARLLIPGSTAGLEHTLRTIRNEASALLSHPLSRGSLLGKRLRFVVLVELESRRQRVLEAVDQLRVGPLHDVRIDVDLAPGPTTLYQFLRG